MGTALVERSPLAREVYQEAREVLGFDLLELCSQGPEEQLNRTEFGQPALFVHSYAALKQLEFERGDLWDNVVSVAGLSLGEYTAVAAAGGMQFADGLKLVNTRGRAMQAAADQITSGMSSILGLDVEVLTELCAQVTTDQEFVQVANLLCPGNTAVSGHIPALERLESLAAEQGAMKCVRLPVAGAFHTSLMQPAVQTLADALTDVNFSSTRVPVFSNVDAAPHSTPDEFRKLLAAQVVEPVQWEASLRSMLDAGTDHFMEVGTGRVLAGTLKRIQRKLPCETYGD